MKLQLEDLREFLQEQLSDSYLFLDDVVIEHLQASMSELRSKRLDQPPPGAVGLFLVFYNKLFLQHCLIKFEEKCCLIICKTHYFIIVL